MYARVSKNGGQGSVLCESQCFFLVKYALLLKNLVKKLTDHFLNLRKAFGIVFGCLLGMFPLLFIDTGKKRSEKEE